MKITLKRYVLRLRLKVLRSTLHFIISGMPFHSLGAETEKA